MTLRSLLRIVRDAGLKDRAGLTSDDVKKVQQSVGSGASQASSEDWIGSDQTAFSAGELNYVAANDSLTVVVTSRVALVLGPEPLLPPLIGL